ncbi:hypothetical protein GGS20DRAFT_595874 [Poronia punctata]|nr:hypothetical protein GGS20DRAFT_595874 [Poronia punctata]
MMDPTTTLFTFMLQTRPSVQSVQLLGSWDNFNLHYKMERDSRRDPGEWRGCHTFDNIVCDGDVPATSERRGGLKMGQTYYYYYELDGSTETYNHTQPTTTTCPFLPGQTLNKLEVPFERRLRLKSASMNSLRNSEYKTMDPADRFATPKPATSGHRREFRISSASSILPKRATRSVSPAPSWTGTARRFLRLKPCHKDADRGRKSNLREEWDEEAVEENDVILETRSATPSGSIRSRDLSPESLRKFLSDDVPCASTNVETASLSIPDDIAEETDYDDDDNFATVPAQEGASFTTLSPPPFQRGGLSAPPASHSRNALPSVAAPPSPFSSVSRGLSQFSFFDDSEEDEEDVASCDGEANGAMLVGVGQQPNVDSNASKVNMKAPITSYSLPRVSTDARKHADASHVLPSLESTALVSQTGTSEPMTNSFGLPNVEIGLQDLVDDMNWVTGVVHQKTI